MSSVEGVPAFLRLPRAKDGRNVVINLSQLAAVEPVEVQRVPLPDECVIVLTTGDRFIINMSVDQVWNVIPGDEL